MPRNVCLRRRPLYERYLDQATKALEVYRAQTTSARVRPALDDAELKALLEALEDILIPYVIYGVIQDLERLKPRNVLRMKATPDLPQLVEMLSPAHVSLPNAGAGAPLEDAVTAAQAYERYFDWYINPDKITQNRRQLSGVDAFYERYPLLAHAVKTATDHYTANIKLACDRVLKDWSQIEAAFFPGKTLTSLARIKTTGNDFHKGGKQVLILTFQLAQGEGKVVYKPSAVEIDCRIVGNSAVVTRVKPDRYTQKESLTEIINRYNPVKSYPGLRFTTKPLPTYVILPYERRSVANAYGYLQFLSHNPVLDVSDYSPESIPEKVNQAVLEFKRRGGDLQDSDWITDKLPDGRVFYHQVGGLMAMALAVSLCDLHVQNAITHDRLPHLIDLEEALKRPMQKVLETYLNEILDACADPGGWEINVTQDRTQDVAISPRSSHPFTPATSALYWHIDPRVVPLDVGSRDDMARALAQGFADVTSALAAQDCNDAVQQWARGLKNTIARFVAVGTAQLAQRFRELYQYYGASGPASLGSPGGYQAFHRPGQSEMKFFEQRVQSARKDFATSLDASGGDTEKKRWAFPVFAIHHPAHAWRDYLNGDVPSFYHRLGDLDLLNSEGKVVKVTDVISWQNAEFKDPGDLREDCGRGDSVKTSALEHYFPQTPIDMVVDQLTRLRQACQTRTGKIAYLKEAVQHVNALSGTAWSTALLQQTHH